MKKIEVDARGQACPKPVIMTKKELDNIEEGIVVTMVDNEVAKNNVSKLAKSLGYEYKVNNIDDGYAITIVKGEGEIEEVSTPKVKTGDTVVVFSAKTMGKGTDELGEILIKSFVYTLTEATPYPATLIFYNSGVYLTCEGSPVLEDLKKLAEEGVEIISCGTCLDYYNIKDKLQVGEISNMYTIYDKMRNAANIINIG